MFNLVSTGIINPNNESAEKEYKGDKYFYSNIADEFPYMLRLLALIYAILTLVGLLLITRPIIPKEIHNYTDKDIKEEECPSIKDGVKTKHFWIMFCMCLCSTTPGLYVINCYKTFGKKEINEDQFLAIVGSIGSIFNGSFRYIWGQLMDKTSFETSYTILICTQTILVMSIYYVATAKATYFIWVCLIMCCEGGHFSLYPTIIAKMYGKK